MARKKKDKTKDGTAPRGQKDTQFQQSQSSGKPLNTSKSNHCHRYHSAHQANHGTLSDSFTLADEARQTSQHDRSFWNQATKLRLMTVPFISAGISEPLKAGQHNETDERQSNTNTPNHHNKSSTEPEAEAEAEAEVANESCRPPNVIIGHDRAGSGKASHTGEATEPEDGIFYYDTGRSSSIKHHGKGKITMAHTSMEASFEQEKSDSDGEIILFKGRLNATHNFKDTIDMGNIRTEIHAVEKEIEEKPHEVIAKQKTTRGRRGGRQAKAKRAAAGITDEEHDGMLADYIENMRENGEMYGLLQPTVAAEEVEDQSSSTNSSGDNNSDKLPVAAALAMQSNKQTPDWFSKEGDTQYTDLDLMDHERPSIRRKMGKGAKQKLDLRFADIDSETERRLQATWQSDRLRKAERKREREQLHVLNLIGKKAKDAEDMRFKYPKGMSLEQVADEIKCFLMSVEDRYGSTFPPRHYLLRQFYSICLPPMDKHARKMIHELANKFNVKSKSIGKTDQRRPTLYRTKRTLRFDNEAFDLAVRRIHRRYFPRLDYKGKNSQGHFSHNGYTEASYRDGEVVGGSAPELSTENRGRAMLEKMGWSIGTALGSEDNKGILLPVTQTMKRSKAGLG
ncbi:hypothetical protein V2A60_007927 [Cordyceps javanica]|uniref:Protein SQS1 n=1 Tax=Cordyceps javanica TaxID=43265 RepID=A0A545V9D0_9HYPO|nr:R3H domain-containing protein [Cordyceps javanica]TQW09540.1 R3H domain-containing protein [Cordyceps javanica]